MKKVAIVGVEGSGKTVMMACLGDLYTSPDDQGYFLRPKNFETASYVMDRISRMRNGEWPAATADDVMQGLNWTLCRKCPAGGRPQEVCEISFLDFGGEVYRAAFGILRDDNGALSKEADELKRYISDADDLIVLINLRDIINKGSSDKLVQESVWITNSILSSALEGMKGAAPRASIAITQSDSYAETIRTCGGAKGVLAKYLPHVANSYDWLDIYDVTAVDKTTLDDDGNIVPSPDFRPIGLRILMDWIVDPQVEEIRNRQIQSDRSTLNNQSGTIKRRPGSERLQKGSSVKRRDGFFSAISRSFDYRGRSSRREYWHFLRGVFVFVIGFVIVLAGVDAGDQDAVASVFGIAVLAAFVPWLSLNVRRAHDIGLSAWIFLVVFIPYVGWVVPLVIGCVKGTQSSNKYGDPIGV